MKASNETLRKIRGSGTDHDPFIFHPDSVKKIGLQWAVSDFELDEKELCRWGELATNTRSNILKHSYSLKAKVTNRNLD